MSSDLPKEIYVTKYPHCEWRDTKKQAEYIAALYEAGGVFKYVHEDEIMRLNRELREAKSSAAAWRHEYNNQVKINNELRGFKG